MNHALHTETPALAVWLTSGVVVAIGAGLFFSYLWGAARLRRAGSNWSGWRTTSFATGCLLMVVALLPPLASWAHQDLRGHMVQHLLLGMFAPLGLVFGAPGSLFLRAASPAAARYLTRWLGRRPVRFISHPITAMLIDIGALYVLYLTPLYTISQQHQGLHFFLHFHFLAAGYLFTWAIAGPDPAPRRPGLGMRLAVLLLATAAHASLGKLMYGFGFPRGTGQPAGEIQAAAQIMYYGGDVAELLLAVGFFSLWFRLRLKLDTEQGGSGAGAARQPS